INQIQYWLKAINKYLGTKHESERGPGLIDGILKLYKQGKFFLPAELSDSDDSKVPLSEQNYLNEIREYVDRFKALPKKKLEPDFDHSSLRAYQAQTVQNELLTTIQKSYQAELKARKSFSNKLEANYKSVIPVLSAEEPRNLCTESAGQIKHQHIDPVTRFFDIKTCEYEDNLSDGGPRFESIKISLPKRLETIKENSDLNQSCQKANEGYNEVDDRFKFNEVKNMRVIKKKNKIFRRLFLFLGMILGAIILEIFGNLKNSKSS
ncbi:hypothetical protein BY996DRAFT_7045029, partial [Phakopsora pachyrhizi]